MTIQCAVCEAVLERAASFYEEYPLCQTCADAAEDYADRREGRIDRLEARAARKLQEARETISRASTMASAIPLGQPILVGHHSENRDRRYRDRIDNTYRRGYEAMQEADRLADRADAAKRNAVIDSDDPLAVLKLADKIAAAEATQARMKATNKVIRAHSSYLPGEPLIAAVKLMDMGYTEEQATRLLTPDSAGRLGYPDFELTNNNANIRRMKARMAELRKSRQAANQTQTQPASAEIAPGVTVKRDTSDNRLRVFFPGKPDDETRAFLKSGGWRWSPSAGAWQRQLNANSEFALDLLTDWLRRNQ